MLGKRLKARRVELGLSLCKLANDANISKAYLWELENKPRKSPSFNIVCRLVEVLELDLNEVAYDNYNGPVIRTERERAIKFDEVCALRSEIVDMWNGSEFDVHTNGDEWQSWLRKFVTLTRLHSDEPIYEEI